MKITFVSNYLNHHQLPFCLEMRAKLGSDFLFVATEPTPEVRIQFGYQEMNTSYDFTLNAYMSEENNQKAIMLLEESDIVIMGSAPLEMKKIRLSCDKPTFIYSERIFKKGRWRILNPRTLRGLMIGKLLPFHRKLRLLCAGAYVASDYMLIGAHRRNMYKWGYFPEMIGYNSETLFKNKASPIIPRILWVGRFISLKHPEHGVYLASMLKKRGLAFALDMIGSGPMENNLRKQIAEHDLDQEIHILGSLSPDQVRKQMETANILIMTSDFNEGWGAVINEAMNSGCAVVASHAIGAVPFLIRDKENGMIYENGDINHLVEIVSKLIGDKEECERIGRNAYATIRDTWNARIAATRLIKLCSSILSNEACTYEKGPCSPVELISQRFLRQRRKTDHLQVEEMGRQNE